MDEQLSASNEFVEEINKNPTICTDPNKISLDSDSSYYDFSSDNDDDIFHLSETVEKLEIKN